MKNAAPITPAPDAHATPGRCPACQSSSIVTTAKKPDASSYWRCMNCGDVFNASRSETDRHGMGANRWRWR
jgi:predicted Zn finger-like uncharacterized protein